MEGERGMKLTPRGHALADAAAIIFGILALVTWAATLYMLIGA